MNGIVVGDGYPKLGIAGKFRLLVPPPAIPDPYHERQKDDKDNNNYEAGDLIFASTSRHEGIGLVNKANINRAINYLHFCHAYMENLNTLTPFIVAKRHIPLS